jgi:hypothetical protein
MLRNGDAVAEPGRSRSGVSKGCVFKILTSKPLALNILQAHFANPAPIAAFEAAGGGGWGY